MEPQAKRPRVAESAAAAHDDDPALSGAIKACDPSKVLFNFSPGPAQLPPAVMSKIHSELLDWRGCGTSVMCLSHRSPEFGVIFEETIATLRRVLEVPETHEVLFAHGGGHGQFAAVPLNLCPEGKACRADYIITGTWSRRAAAEAAKYVTVRTAADTAGVRALPADADLDATASYRYICSNETVDGIEFHAMPRFDDDVPLVVDMSSDVASKRLDWSRVAVAFACAPKNIGHAGLTVVVVRRDLLATRTAQPGCPGVLNWRTNSDAGGMWNTPPTFNIYTTGKVLDWVEGQGGIAEMESRSACKASLVYGAIAESGGFYDTPCAYPSDRSRMNVPFNVGGGDAALTEAFLREAYALNMVGFRTKTPFGYGAWLRASLYLGTSIEQVNALAAFMRSFAERWGGERSALEGRAYSVQEDGPESRSESPSSCSMSPVPSSGTQSPEGAA